MRRSASTFLAAGPLLLLLLLEGGEWPVAASAAGEASEEEGEEADLERRLDSDIADVASSELEQEEEAEEAQRHRRFWPSFSFWSAEPTEPVKQVDKEAPVEQMKEPRVRREHIRIDPVALKAAKEKLDKSRYYRDVYSPAHDGSRYYSAEYALRGAGHQHHRHHRLSALDTKPRRGWDFRGGRKMMEKALRRLGHARMPHYFQRHARFGHRHSGLDLYRHRPSRASLAAAAVSVTPAVAQPEESPEPSPAAAAVFPRPHPSVERALGGMDGEVKLLRGQRDAAMRQSAEVRDFAQKAHDGIKAGAAVRRSIAAAKADVKIEEKVLRRIMGEQKRLRVEHNSIQGKLHKAMDPRISVREVLVAKKQHQLEKTEKDVHKWMGRSATQKESALQTLRQRKMAQGDLEEAEETMRLAEQKEEKAKEAYEESKKHVTQQVQALNVFETKLRAEKSVQIEQEQSVSDEEISLDRTKNILKVELNRLDEALTNGEERLATRFAKTEKTMKKAERKLAKAKTKYAAWTKEQKQLADRVAQEVDEYEGQRRAFYNKREGIMKSAADQAGAQATAESDFDDSDWAWSGGAEGVAPEDYDF